MNVVTLLLAQFEDKNTPVDAHNCSFAYSHKYFFPVAVQLKQANFVIFQFVLVWA